MSAFWEKQKIINISYDRPYNYDLIMVLELLRYNLSYSLILAINFKHNGKCTKNIAFFSLHNLDFDPQTNDIIMIKQIKLIIIVRNDHSNHSLPKTKSFVDHFWEDIK